MIIHIYVYYTLNFPGYTSFLGSWVSGQLYSDVWSHCCLCVNPTTEFYGNRLIDSINHNDGLFESIVGDILSHPGLHARDRRSSFVLTTVISSLYDGLTYVCERRRKYKNGTGEVLPPLVTRLVSSFF